MEAKRVLVVEPDAAFGLSLAGLFRGDGCATAVAHSAADAEREIAARPPDLVVVRAELPDLSGFALCGRLRRERPGLPLVLLSSDATADALAEHARTPGAAHAYLSMPVDTAALVRFARGLLAAPPLEPADDAVFKAGAPVEVRVGAPAPAPASAVPSPPPVPRRARRSEVTDEDRLFLERTFQSIADRRAGLVAESQRRRPPPPRQLLATPEGRLALLREDLKAREAQVARLAQIWEARERDLAGADARLHEKEVELQSLKLRVDDLSRKLAEARDLLVAREREHGASVEGLLLERFSQEKDLIEVVAGKERRIAELEREIRQRDEDLARRQGALEGAARELGRLEAEGQRWREAGEEALRRSGELERELAARAGPSPAPGAPAPGEGEDPGGGASGL
jgi:ParB family chromosome partitioning protein